MSPDLEKKIYDKYPEIFVEKDLPMDQTCMCWGLSCGNGWYHIIDNLCINIKCHLIMQRHKGIEIEDVVFEQVKEKFGELRVYYRGGDETTDKMITMAESFSRVTCENCGETNPEKVGRTNKGWIRVLCSDCINDELKNDSQWKLIRYCQ